MLLTVLKHFHSDRLDRSIYFSLQMINTDQLKRANRSFLSAESLTNPSQMLHGTKIFACTWLEFMINLGLMNPPQKNTVDFRGWQGHFSSNPNKVFVYEVLEDLTT